MSGKPVSLNRVRKQKARTAKRVRADENAAKFGRSKAEKARDRAQSAKADAHLDDHRLKP